MRIATVGKGSAGKSPIAGTLALDVDTMPGLVLSLGMNLGAVGDAGLPEDLGERQEGRGWVLKEEFLPIFLHEEVFDYSGRSRD